MVTRQHRAQRLAVQRQVTQMAGQVAGKGDADIDAAAVERRLQVARQGFVEAQADCRAFAAVGLDQPRQQVPGSAHGKAQAQFAALPSSGGLGRAHGRVEVGQQALGVPVELLASQGQADRA
ncbi:hypothetical protein D9M68_715560 [compost metagenome]